MYTQLWQLIADQEGAATVEYALLLAVLVLSSLGAWLGLGANVKKSIAAATNALSRPLG
ncbi:MAG TPA: Flp family type IVb pilin [Armatimonadota bacterium]|jgi:Flp pilus assembly pilin Flp